MCLENTVSDICIDYMQHLHPPRDPVQETFYLRQLIVNVLNIYNYEVMIYVYHE